MTRFKIAILYYSIKRSFLRLKGYNIGKFSQLERGVKLDKLNKKGIFIGNYTLIAKGSVILSHSHPKRTEEDSPKMYTTSIGNNCFIGINSIIEPGVRIGNSVIVCDGSVVTKDIESNCIVGGNPANKIKSVNCGIFGKIL